MKIIAYSIIFLSILSQPAFSQNNSLYNQPSDELTRVRQFIDGQRKKGNVGVTIGGFNNPKGIALTAIKTSKDEFDFIRTAEISQKREGAGLFFRTYRSCTKTDMNKINEVIVSVNNQGVRTAYFCTHAADDPRVTQEIYVPMTPEGQEFIHKSFISKEYVFVKLIDGLEFPFSTEGFSTILATLNKPAL